MINVDTWQAGADPKVHWDNATWTFPTTTAGAITAYDGKYTGAMGTGDANNDRVWSQTTWVNGSNNSASVSFRVWNNAISDYVNPPLVTRTEGALTVGLDWATLLVSENYKFNDGTRDVYKFQWKMTIPNKESAWSTTYDAPVGLLAPDTRPDTPAAGTLTENQVDPLLTEALARFQAAGVDTSVLGKVNIVITNLAGNLLGEASGNTIWLDVNAAGYGWFVDSTPGNDSEFTTPGNQGEKHHLDLLTVVMHELGHLLGYQHTDSGLMDATLATGVRETPTGVIDGFFARR